MRDESQKEENYREEEKAEIYVRVKSQFGSLRGEGPV
jgi:hypothetical protein